MCTCHLHRSSLDPPILLRVPLRKNVCEQKKKRIELAQKRKIEQDTFCIINFSNYSREDLFLFLFLFLTVSGPVV
jgi:hypothetical protein